MTVDTSVHSSVITHSLTMRGLTIALWTMLSCAACTAPGDPGAGAAAADTIRVVSIRYFPVNGALIDSTTTGDWGETADSTRRKVEAVQAELVSSLAEGSTYHGYRNDSARPATVYDVVKEFEFLEALPTLPPKESDAPFTDYASIMTRIGAKDWVESERIKEIWIWAYHGGVVGLWESNMSSPFHDISNSDRVEDDLPIFSRTYTVYHYNYQRGTAEAMENHMHQLEAVLNYFDGRDSAAAENWPNLLFWGKFVGSDTSHRLLKPVRAGWSHYPPNASKDYEWDNPAPVFTDIRNWNPEGTGRPEPIACDVWECDHRKWFIFWTQNIPGRDNGLFYEDRPLRNWWTFLTDTDTAFRENWKLWE